MSPTTSTCSSLNAKRSRAAAKAAADKNPIQNARRNARERRRVQAVNSGYERLAQQIGEWEKLKNKKLTKAETLKAAIDYIQHLESMLTQNGTAAANNHSTQMKAEDFERYESKFVSSAPFYGYYNSSSSGSSNAEFGNENRFVESFAFNQY